ncbi:hypothetical protein AAMO2058_000420900 [Amorphochlora amoebiformis]
MSLLFQIPDILPRVSACVSEVIERGCGGGTVLSKLSNIAMSRYLRHLPPPSLVTPSLPLFEASLYFYRSVFPTWDWGKNFLSRDFGPEPSSDDAIWVFATDELAVTGWRAPERPVWCDFLVDGGTGGKRGGREEGGGEGERRCAKVLEETMGYRIQDPIAFPEGEYITLFSPDGGLDNRSKVGGVLPRSAIIPANATYPSPSALLQADIHDPEIKVNEEANACLQLEQLGVTYLPFFEVDGSEGYEETKDAISKAGGLCLNEVTADGQVAIIQDCVGAYFALYHRTDDPDVIKEGTKLAETSDWD